MTKGIGLIDCDECKKAIHNSSHYFELKGKVYCPECWKANEIPKRNWLEKTCEEWKK